MISILSFGAAHKHTHLWATQCGSDNPRRRERITLQRREKGHGAEREREKLEGERRERSRRNIWTKSPEQSIGPPGQAPRRGERSDHKVTAAFPLQGAAVT